MATGRDFYVDQPLTNALVGFENPDFIAGRVGNEVKVTKKTGIYPKLLQSQWFRNLAQPRMSGSKATESSFGTDLTATYYLPEYAHAVRVQDDDREVAAGTPFQLDVLASKLAANVVALKREITLAAAFFASSKGWVDTVAGTEFQAWDDAAASNPMLDIDKLRDTQEGLTGSEPNTLIVGKVAFTNGLKWNPALIDLIRFTQKGMLNEALVAEMLGVNLLIGKAIYTASVEGTAEASVSYSRVWGKSALLINQPANTMMTAPALARVSMTAGAGEYTAHRWRYEEEGYDKFEARTRFLFKQIVANAGTFMGSVVS